MEGGGVFQMCEEMEFLWKVVCNYEIRMDGKQHISLECSKGKDK